MIYPSEDNFDLKNIGRRQNYCNIYKLDFNPFDW